MNCNFDIANNIIYSPVLYALAVFLEQGRKTWNETLSRIEVNDPNVDHLRTFYSCLYRSVLFPRSFYEIDANGNTVHYSPYNGEVRPGYMFTDTGFWDTFRCLFPFLNMMYPSMNDKMQEGLVNAYLESGFLPEWASPGHRGCMVGNNSASIVVDAIMTGRKGYDKDKLWEAVLHGANSVHPQVKSTGRDGFELYNKLGYVPCDKLSQSVARTLEYAYNDWCIYTMGKALFARYLFFFDIKGLKIVKWVVDIYVARLAERCTIILFNNKTYLYYNNKT